MDYKKMWEDLKGLMQKTEKMTDLIKTKGILDMISEIEKLNTEYEDLPFQEDFMEFEKLYMFNPFTIQNADSQKIADTYSKLQNELADDADTGFLISKNIEIYANMNYLIGEMIARIQQEYDTLKTDISISENKQVYMQRKQWQETRKSI